MIGKRQHHEKANSDELHVLCSFATEFEADMAKALLEEDGIPALVQSDSAGGMNPTLAFATGVRLLVFAKDLPMAREVLARQASS